MRRDYFTCQSCGERVEFGGEERPSDALDGWLMLCQWNGPEAVEHYSFCSMTCLKTWMDTRVPQVPSVFLKAFKKGED